MKKIVDEILRYRYEILRDESSHEKISSIFSEFSRFGFSQFLKIKVYFLNAVIRSSFNFRSQFRCIKYDIPCKFIILRIYSNKENRAYISSYYTYHAILHLKIFYKRLQNPIYNNSINYNRDQKFSETISPVYVFQLRVSTIVYRFKIKK